jgi:hypothetical protein
MIFLSGYNAHLAMARHGSLREFLVRIVPKVLINEFGNIRAALI